jgi:RNA polymerase sigma-70 factor (sigma-E family)
VLSRLDATVALPPVPPASCQQHGASLAQRGRAQDDRLPRRESDLLGQPSRTRQTLRTVHPTFEEFAAARTGALLRYAHVLTGERARAEDLVQDALAGAYRHWSQVRNGSPEGYVRRSILNGYLGRWRRVGRWEQPEAAVPDHIGPDQTDMVVERDAMRQALAGLPPRMRAVLVLRFYEDMSEPQAAAALGVSVGTIKSTTSRALDKLRNSDVLNRETIR